MTTALFKAKSLAHFGMPLVTLKTPLGEGAYGKVYELSTGEALKIIKPADCWEVYILSQIWRPSRPRLNTYYAGKHESRFFPEIHEAYDFPDETLLRMEMLHGGTILDRVRNGFRPTERELLSLLLDLWDAVSYLHDRGYAISPAINIMISYTSPKPPKRNLPTLQSLLRHQC